MDSSETEPVSYRFERRACPRERVRATASAVYADGRGRAGLTPIEMVDSSTGGIGLRSRCRIEPGMMVTIFHGSGTSWIEGVAVRCAADGERFRVGLAVERRMAA